MFSILGGELQRHSDLVASLAKGASVDESREGDRDPVPQFLLVAETHLKIRIGLEIDCIWDWGRNWIQDWNRDLGTPCRDWIMYF